MPTLPPGEPAPLHSDRLRARRVAESFGVDPERYDRTRPGYPDALVEAVVAAAPGRHVLDVGIGTGIVARRFRAAGCTVLGVDPDARMADRARRDGHEVEVAPFEAWDPAGRSFDAVVSGQTWHWVDPVAGAAKAAEALRRGGRLAVFWNDGRPPRDLAEAFAGVYGRFAPDAPAARFWRAADGKEGHPGYAALLTRAADGMRAAGAFGEPEVWRFAWERSYTRDAWLDQLPTTGGHADLPPAVLARLSAAVGAAVDAAGGAFTMRYTTVVVTAARGGPGRS
ncbi:class I SAM-dependent methyltransferase [Streptomyces somaliensis]|uniref:Class I SAM-dependent methyltransferase n=1 Tax=Streptomyces somaliensis (strain ATCC 33201 / DSM 40738 / JCM 12659 / KCTC 9044 / NCTC 11332 / NRRL B-12077 / IP 733) TaxID=1134445 RepID=A0AA44DGH2_STRE0|nr:class I SAM-dependent methyltransferase [Streptomyces somaliensis]NKY15990.1 class I SAM-dependent methyltransferase [Streptomyces somaliensis DSM 40738]